MRWGFTTPQPNNNSQEGALCIDIGCGSTIPARGRVLIIIARPLKHVYLSISPSPGRTYVVRSAGRVLTTEINDNQLHLKTVRSRHPFPPSNKFDLASFRHLQPTLQPNPRPHQHQQSTTKHGLGQGRRPPAEALGAPRPREHPDVQVHARGEQEERPGLAGKPKKKPPVPTCVSYLDVKTMRLRCDGSHLVQKRRGRFTIEGNTSY